MSYPIFERNEEITPPPPLLYSPNSGITSIQYEGGIFDRDGVEISDVDDYDSAEEFNQF